MKLRLLALGLLVSMSLTLAQTPKAAADPISGTWKGDMAPKGETRRYGITMELKFDGTSAVSGTVTGSGGETFKIKTGTVDPKTGALRLEVDRDGGNSLFVFEGTVTGNMATGRVSGDNQNGDFKLTKAPPA